MFLRDGGAVGGGGRGEREGRLGWDGMGWGMVLWNDGCLANGLLRDE